MIGSSTSAKLLAVSLLFVVLAAGFLMGMAWDEGEASVSPAVTDPQPEGGSRSSLVIDEVGLESEQREEVDRIIHHFRAQMRALDKEFREAYRPRQGELLAQTRDSIKTGLSPKQREVYDSLLEARYGDSPGDDGRRRTRRSSGGDREPGAWE